MDSAVYDSTDNLIIGVRGGRIFQCDPVTGAVNFAKDFSQPGFGPSCLAWDSGTNTVFASCWNSPQWANYAQPQRLLCVISPGTLLTSSAVNQDTFLGGPYTYTSEIFYGISNMRALNGYIFGHGFVPVSGSHDCRMICFNAANPSTIVYSVNTSIGDYSSLAVAMIGGNETLAAISNVGGFIEIITSLNGTPIAANQTASDYTKTRLALEWAPVQGNLYVTRTAEFIDVYTLSGTNLTFSSTIDTGRSNFTGVNIRFNPYDGFLYAAGMGDNTIVKINPADNTFVVKSGFDLPTDLCFTPTKVWAVQNGSIPLMEVI